MSSEEVKTENSSQENKAEAKTYSDEQFKGLLADKQAEVILYPQPVARSSCAWPWRNTPAAGD